MTTIRIIINIRLVIRFILQQMILSIVYTIGCCIMEFMKIALIYGTLSGSTMTASETAAAELRSAGNDVNVVSVESANKDALSGMDAVVIASPSWEDQGKDGQPLPEVRMFLEGLTAQDFSGKKVALLGLGDTAYPHFCGAIDVMEGMLKERSVTPVTTSLRIDRYYSLPDNEQKVKDWAQSLGKILSS
jgi:flavodoxin I